MAQTLQLSVVHHALEEGAVELREMPIPEIGADEVLLKVGAVSVCGSEVHQYRNSHSWPVNIPVILGHEFGGTIVEVGANIRGFAEGDHVVSETAAEICGICLMCRHGRYNLCQNRKGFGYGVNGAMTSFVKVPERCLHRIPEGLAFELACLTEPCSVAYHAICVNADINPGDLVVVMGPGPIGLLCARMAALSGAEPLVVAGRERDADRLAIAAELGATRTVNVDSEDLEEVVMDLSNGLGADVVCDASGASRPLELAMRMARPDGQVVKVGWSPTQEPMDLNPLVQKNLRIQGSFSHTYLMWEKVLGLLASGSMMADKVVSMKTDIAGWQSAFDAMHSGTAIKAVLIPDG